MRQVPNVYLVTVYISVCKLSQCLYRQFNAYTNYTESHMWSGLTISPSMISVLIS